MSPGLAALGRRSQAFPVNLLPSLDWNRDAEEASLNRHSSQKWVTFRSAPTRQHTISLRRARKAQKNTGTDQRLKSLGLRKLPCTSTVTISTPGAEEPRMPMPLPAGTGASALGLTSSTHKIPMRLPVPTT